MAYANDLRAQEQRGETYCACAGCGLIFSLLAVILLPLSFTKVERAAARLSPGARRVAPSALDARLGMRRRPRRAPGSGPCDGRAPLNGFVRYRARGVPRRVHASSLTGMLPLGTTRAASRPRDRPEK
mmetsp:Transcript_25420/g.76356  ORF Transcript_25420/g.76356 Transcript_25420/m.76356 type:complete len:128 (+) Transcript_25420:184-567(+)